MSSNLSRNLSYSINLPKATVHSEEVMVAVNKTLTKYYYETHYADYMKYYDLHRSIFKNEKPSAVMQSEKIILCEINACLWNKALNSAISNITKQTYPHYVIVQNVINFILSPSSNEYFGLAENFLNKLLISHPPTADMFDYYWQILSDQFVILNNKKTEEETLLFCLIEVINNYLKISQNDMNMTDMNNLKFQAMEIETSPSCKINPGSLEVKHLKKVDENDRSSATKTNKKHFFFMDLPSDEQIKRCLFVLNFVYDILETNFSFWLQSRNLKPNFTDIRPLMSSLLWPNMRDIGLMNKEVNKLLELYKVVQSSNSDFRIFHLTKKLITLLGEIVRCSDYIDEIKYPFVGIKTDNFFRELSLILHECIVGLQKNSKENELIVSFKPPWLQLFVCSHLLSLLTGYQCLPELTGVYDILEHIVHSQNRNQSTLKPSEKPVRSMNSRLMAKLKRFKSINTKLRSGKTLLHVACEENDTEKIKALLSFPELDVNAVDQEGWTALHTSAHKGNITSVQELLLFGPKSEGAQKPANTRARGPQSTTPLMCAVIQGHAKICQMLLEHSGSVLLEDVNELNQTPLELSNVPDVTDILQYYKKNSVWTFHSHKDINFDPDLKEIVIKLCVEMIQAYFSTYRTWDVYKTLKRSQTKFVTEDLNVNFKWDYMRYHRDIKRNIYKLRKLLPKLEHLKEFKGVNEVFVRILSFNKTC